MITIHDLDEAIAECNGQKNPDANTCIKLASYYTIKKELENVSRETPAELDQVRYYSEAEPELWNGKTLTELIPLLDELMDALYVLNPKLYNSFMNKF